MNNVTKPVVVAIADKQPSALRFAADAARVRRAPLRVVHSTNVPLQVAELVAGELTTMPEEYQAVGRALVDDARQFLESLDPDLAVDYVLTPQAPIDALMEEASRALLLVVGADDVPWFERLLRTKIAGYLAKHAPCPVVVVPVLYFPPGA
jgi:nucleotide-binding universal stress UspA family protein